MKKILVTGAARSGTTILGRILNFAPDTNFLLEPFNRYVWMHSPHYHAYIGPNSTDIKHEHYQKFITSVFNMQGLIPWPKYTGKSPLESLALKVRLRRITVHTKLAILRQRYLSPHNMIYKDPSACFLASHLAHKHDCNVVYTIRHPAAIFVARKELNWRFDCQCLELQPDLIDSFGDLWGKLDPLKDGGILEQSIILWMCIYSTLYKLEKEQSSRVLCMRHEDWCESPLERIEELYDKLGLQWTKKVESKVRAITTGLSATRKTASLATMEARDSKAIIYKWKNKVSQSELDKIMEYCGKLMDVYYPEAAYRNLN